MAVGVYFPFVSIPIDAAGPHSQEVSYVLFSQTSLQLKNSLPENFHITTERKTPTFLSLHTVDSSECLPSFQPSWLQILTQHSSPPPQYRPQTGTFSALFLLCPCFLVPGIYFWIPSLDFCGPCF